MIKNLSTYKFSVSEEIARWTLEIYVQKEKSLGWWVAFTNPTAGPWKTISSVDIDGKIEEIYRFAREENRPDLVLVNDSRKEIMIIEAKEVAANLLSDSQMTKSVAVMNDMGIVLKGLNHNSWKDRKDFKIIPGFLWYCENEGDVMIENNQVNDFYSSRNTFGLGNPFNTVIIKRNEELIPMFVSQGKIKTNINE